MQVRFTKSFPDYPAADAWIESNGYSESVINITHDGKVTVTLEGEHAVRAIEQDTKAKAIVTEAAA
jgi:hypothetical protein